MLTWRGNICVLLVLASMKPCQAQQALPDIRYVQTQQLKVGTKMAIPEIWFGVSRYSMMVRTESSDLKQLPHNAIDSLKVVYRFLKFYPRLKVEIGVHTDCRGSDKYSVRLSGRRAQTLADSLVSWGIRRERVKFKGYEKSEPIIPCDDISKMSDVKDQEAAHHVNRRIELKILGTDYLTPSYLYEGYNGHRAINEGDDLTFGDQFKVVFPSIYDRKTIEWEGLLNKMETCATCAYEIVCPESISEKGDWKLRQFRRLVYLEKMNTEKCRVSVSPDIEDSFLLVKVSNEPYTEPFLMFKGQRDSRSIFKDDTLKTGDEFILAIEYDYDKADIRPRSKIILTWLGEKLTALDTFKIIIESHTDCRGNDYYNNRLSHRRAQSVTEYLLDQFDFPDNSILPKGMGEEDPLSETSCEEINRLPSVEEREKIHQMNRRTVVKVKLAE